MNTQTANASMKEMGAKIKKEWAKLTDDDLGLLEANRDEFFARVEKKQGIAREQAEQRLKEWKKAA
jgi:uncharacterized protein YjbJ (UPF0337 family)